MLGLVVAGLIDMSFARLGGFDWSLWFVCFCLLRALFGFGLVVLIFGLILRGLVCLWVA